MTQTQQMSTVERLTNPGVFAPEVLERIGDIAPGIEAQDFDTLSKNFPATETFQPVGSNQQFEVWDYSPKGGHDQVIVMHLPMAANLTRAHKVALWTLGQMVPNTRTIAMGNAGPFSEGSTGRLNFSDMWKVMHSDFAPAVLPRLEYLETNPIEQVEEASQVGASYGATTAIEATKQAGNYISKVPNLVSMDAATSINWGNPLEFKLPKAFSASGVDLAETIKNTHFPALIEAREGDPSLGAYKRAVMLRAGSIAIGIGLSKGGLETQLSEALEAQPDMHAAVMWGGASDLAPNDVMESLASRVAARYGDRVSSLTLPNKNHTMLVDVMYEVAMIMQGLRGKA
jgi:hypothetical protein